MGGRVIPLGGDDDDAREEALAEADRLEAGQTEDFDAFWAAQDRKATSLKNVFGVAVTLPAALPLRFEVEARRVSESNSEDDTRRMVGILFGPDALDRWTEAGMDLDQFAVLLLWGTANTRTPNSMTLAEAKDAMDRQIEAKTSGKEPATTSGVASSGTGPRSKRTSRASTGSRKKK